MKRIIFTLLMTAISSNALAGWSVRDLSDELSTRATDRSKHAPVGMLGEWVVVGETRSYVVYADLSSIQVSGDKVTMWDMFDKKTDEQNLRGKKYLSSRSQQEFDCKAETSKQLLTAIYTEHLGQGSVVFSGDFREIHSKHESLKSGSIIKSLWDTACGNLKS